MAAQQPQTQEEFAEALLRARDELDKTYEQLNSVRHLCGQLYRQLRDNQLVPRETAADDDDVTEDVEEDVEEAEEAPPTPTSNPVPEMENLNVGDEPPSTGKKRERNMANAIARAIPDDDRPLLLFKDLKEKNFYYVPQAGAEKYLKELKETIKPYGTGERRDCLLCEMHGNLRNSLSHDAPQNGNKQSSLMSHVRAAHIKRFEVPVHCGCDGVSRGGVHFQAGARAKPFETYKELYQHMKGSPIHNPKE